MEEQNIKLTKLTKCAGCGAKVGAGVLAQLLEGCGVDLRYLGRTETPQGHAIIQVQPDGQNCIFLYGGSNQAVTPEARSPPPTPSATCTPWAASRSCV